MELITNGYGHGLMERDIEVLRDLNRMRYLKTTQIERLHFPSRRVANRRLEVLSANEYIDRFRVPALVGQGSGEYVCCLRELGGEVIAARDGNSQQVPARTGHPKSFMFFEHLLAIHDFGITIQAACVQSGLTLGAFIPEYYGQRSPSGGFRRLIADSAPSPSDPSQALNFIPDAVFSLERSGKRALFFLEIDRGTEKVTSTAYAAFVHKISTYTSYLASGGFKRWGEQYAGFRVLIVTSNEKRLANLIASVPAGSANIMWFTTAARISVDSLFADIWRVPGNATAQTLVRG